MNKYNKILEAIQKGINIALDDYEDLEILTLIDNQLKDSNQTKELIDFYNQFVDLGLPSGTLWAKYNLGCDWDKLNKNPENASIKEWYGGYYAWGETSPRTNFFKEDYKFYNYVKDGSQETEDVTKYAPNMRNGRFYDGLCNLLLVDDAAYQQNHLMRIPSMEQFIELVQFTDNSWVPDYKHSGVNGWLFKANNNELFFPACGEFEKDRVKLDGMRGHYWTNTCKEVSINEGAKYVFFDHKGIETSYSSSKYDGLSIRPIMKKQ